MISLDVRADTRAISASLTRFVDDQRKAAVRALNKTAVTARAEAAREVRSAGYNIKASAIKRSFSIKKATRNSLLVTLTATGAPIALINYGARQSKSGVTVQVKSGRKLLKHAFIATMPNGHRGVFQRVGNAHKVVKRNNKKIQTGLPIKELFGPSIPQSLANSAVEKALMDKIKRRFPEVLKQELNFLSKGR